jgi:hypothetical protein
MRSRSCANNAQIGNARLVGLAVEVLTALGERDGAVPNAERRAGEALRTSLPALPTGIDRRVFGVIRLVGRGQRFGTALGTKPRFCAQYPRATTPAAKFVRGPDGTRAIP